MRISAPSLMVPIFSLAVGCGAPPASDLSALEGETVESFAFAQGTWRLMAKYPDSVQGSNGAYSGLTAVIGVGDNPVSDFEGERTCDLMVRSKDSDYRALDLPGNDGELMNPCSIIAATTAVYPYSGSSESSGSHPGGGQMTVYYDDGGKFGGFRAEGGELGIIVLSINNIAPLPNGGEVSRAPTDSVAIDQETAPEPQVVPSDDEEA